MCLFFKKFEFGVFFILWITCLAISAQHQQQKCSNRLESALDNMARRSHLKSGGRSTIDISPYSVYQSLYNEDSDLDMSNGGLDEKLDNLYERQYPPGNHRNPHKLAISRVDVADLKVRLPPTERWVEVDRCQFNNANRTLNTRLMFPDLTISGKVIVQPTGGKCSMILRLRRAGIEFRTIPLDANLEESRRSGSASVRTDSRFAEPGFISVFAHGCEGPTGIRLRENSKRSRFKVFGNRPPDYSTNTQERKFFSYDDEYQQHRNSRWMDSAYRHPRDIRPRESSGLHFDEDILGYKSSPDEPMDGRTLQEIFAGSWQNNRYVPKANANNNNPHENENDPSENDDEISDALSRELEQLFSMGVRGLLTTYMQKALQPAIKETLMENMGYTLSYG